MSSSSFCSESDSLSLIETSSSSGLSFHLDLKSSGAGDLLGTVLDGCSSSHFSMPLPLAVGLVLIAPDICVSVAVSVSLHVRDANSVFCLISLSHL